MRTGGSYALFQLNKPYELCFFENDFCLNLLCAWLNYLTNCAWIYVDQQEDYFVFCTFSHLNDFAFLLIAPLLTEEKKRKEKNRMKTHRSMSRVREKASLLRLLSGLAFLVFGLLKQVNSAVEGKTKVAIFAPFSVSVISFFG